MSDNGNGKMLIAPPTVPPAPAVPRQTMDVGQCPYCGGVLPIAKYRGANPGELERVLVSPVFITALTPIVNIVDHRTGRPRVSSFESLVEGTMSTVRVLVPHDEVCWEFAARLGKKPPLLAVLAEGAPAGVAAAVIDELEQARRAPWWKKTIRLVSAGWGRVKTYWSSLASWISSRIIPVLRGKR